MRQDQVAGFPVRTWTGPKTAAFCEHLLQEIHCMQGESELVNIVIQ